MMISDRRRRRSLDASATDCTRTRRSRRSARCVPGLVLVGFSARAAASRRGSCWSVGTAGLGPSLLVVMGEIVPRELRGTGAGLLQFCGDVGGMLGPLVGTAFFARSTSVPYLGTAALLACLVPVAAWLGKVEEVDSRNPAA